MKSKFITCFAIVTSLIAQNTEWNGGFYSKFGDGKQDGNPYNYFENYLTINGSIGNWNSTTEFDYNSPPEYGINHMGIRLFNLQYIGNQSTIEMGHINSVFGNGLSLNLFEDKTIDFDNRPIGLKAQYDFNENWQTTGLVGINQNYSFYSPRSNIRIPDGESSFRLGGIQITYIPDDGSWGFSPHLVISRFQSDVIWKELMPETLEIIVLQYSSVINPGFVLSIYQNNWDGVFEISANKKKFDKPLIKQEYDNNNLIIHESITEQFGNSIYSQINLYPEWFTLIAEYKRYSWNVTGLEDKIDLYRQSMSPLPYQMGPTGIRQHDIGLIGNVTHPVDYSDEVGVFVEITKNFDNLLGKFSFVNASRIQNWNKIADELWYPSQKLEYYPFVEYYAELEASSDAITNRSVLAFTKLSNDGHLWEQHITFTPFYASWTVKDNLVLNLVSTVQLSHRGEEQYKSHQYISSVDFGSKLSIAGILDLSDDPELVGDGQWISGEITLKPKSSMWIRASSGAEKGGVRCTSGVCRVISPFEGFRLAMEVRI